MSVYNQIFAILLLVALVSCFAKLGLKEYYAKLMAIYLLWLICTFVASVYVVRGLGIINNLFLFHLSTPIDYAVLALLYHGVMISTMVKRWIVVSIPAYILLSIYLSLFVQPIDENNTYSIIFGSTLLICWSLFFLREVLLYRPAMRLLRYPMFWISVGILFYYTGSLLIESMLNFMIRQDMPLARRLYRIVYVFKYLLMVLIIIGAFCQTIFRDQATLKYKSGNV